MPETKATIKFQAKTAQAEAKINRFSKLARGAVLGLAAAGAAAVGAMIKSSVRLFAQQDKAEKQIAAAVKKFGASAGVTTDSLKKIASEYQKVSTVGDEVSLSILNTGLRIGDLNKDTLPKFLDTANDLAITLGKDVTSASQILAKSLGSPTKAITQLERYGIQFNETEREKIKVLTESGKKSEAQAFILQKLQDRVGGASEASVKGVGVWKQYSNRLGDAAEGVGEFATDIANVFYPVFVKALDLVEGFGRIWVKVAKTIGIVGGAIKKIIWATVQTPVQEAHALFQNFVRSLMESDLVKWVAEKVGLAFDSVGESITELGKENDTFGKILDDTKDKLNGVWNAEKKVDEETVDLTTSTADLGDTVKDTGEKMDEYKGSWLDYLGMLIKARGEADKLVDAQNRITDAANDMIGGRDIDELSPDEQLEKEKEADLARQEIHANRIQEQFAEADAANRKLEDEKKKNKEGIAEAKKSAKQAIAIFAERSSKIKAMHKAIRIAETIASTASAVMQAVRGAHTNFLPPVSTAVAAANSAVIIGTGAAQLAAIKKMQAGGVVGGINRGIDSVPALLQPGEIVLPRTGESYADLRAGILRQAEADNYDREPQEISITIDQDGLGQFIRAELASERSLQGA